MSNPLWAGDNPEFGQAAIDYTAGQDILLDRKLIQYDCLTMQAHLLMLYRTGLVDKDTARLTIECLRQVAELDAQGNFILAKELEDVHSNIEYFVIKRIGIEKGGNMRLGIARNDQVYTDTRLYIRDEIRTIMRLVVELINTLTHLAEQHTATIMPGYTHLRISQPTSYGHFLTAKAYHFLDDLHNLMYDYDFVNRCPLGIVEMAGTHLPIDRKMVADYLGFPNISKHTMYTANQRGEIEIKLLADLALVALHIRRAAQEIITFSTFEFGLMEIDDHYTTGGTAQPNLRNPDTLEIMRASAPKVYGKLFETISVMDMLPSGYNRDTQVSKAALFESIDVIASTLLVFRGVIESLKLNTERMQELADLNFATAPDITIEIAHTGGISFREAYQVVKALIEKGYLKESFAELTPELLAEVASRTIGKQVTVPVEALQKVASATARVFSQSVVGGPAPNRVQEMIGELGEEINNINRWLDEREDQIRNAHDRLRADSTALLS